MIFQLEIDNFDMSGGVDLIEKGKMSTKNKARMEIKKTVTTQQKERHQTREVFLKYEEEKKRDCVLCVSLEKNKRKKKC